MDISQQIELLERLARLRASGALTDCEYAEEQRLVLSRAAEHSERSVFTESSPQPSHGLSSSDEFDYDGLSRWVWGGVAALVALFILSLMFPWIVWGLPIIGGALIAHAIAQARGGAPWLSSGIIGLLGATFFWVSYAAYSVNERSAARAAVEASNKQRQEAEKAEKEAEDYAQDAAQASKWGLTVEQYRYLDSKTMDAAIYCQSEVKEHARWTAEDSPGWFSFLDYSWAAVDPQRIRIHSNNVRMTNGFGGARDVSYSCVYNTETKDAFVEWIN